MLGGDALEVGPARGEEVGYRPGLTTEEQDWLERLEQEDGERRRACEILLKASPAFARSELDRSRR